MSIIEKAYTFDFDKETDICCNKGLYSDKDQKIWDLLLLKIKNMPDFQEVFDRHIKEFDDKDPFSTFVYQAIIHWNLFDYLDQISKNV